MSTDTSTQNKIQLDRVEKLNIQISDTAELARWQLLKTIEKGKKKMSNIQPVDQLKKTLANMATQFKAALPPHISHERFVRVIQTAISTNPALVKADRTSFLAACLKLAEKGLAADGVEAALVTFGDKVTAMPMLAGTLKLVRNSGELKTITAQMVYKNDKFKYWVDSDGEHLNHEPNLFSERGEAIGVYSMAVTKENGVYIEVLTMADIEKVKKSSRSAANGPWVTWFEQMAKKSAIRRLAKRLPSSTDLDTALSDDDRAEFVDVQPAKPQQEIDVTEPAPEQEAPQEKKLNMEKIVEANEIPI